MPPDNGQVTADAALVLGAAIDVDQPSPVFAARIDHAVSLLQQGRVQHIIFTGGTAPGASRSEAMVARRYAMDKGVAPSAILIEDRSATTHENLAFAMPIASKAGIRSVLLVSDALHLRRAELMARGLGYSMQLSGTPTSRYRSLTTRLPFALREVYFIHHYWIFEE
ncbi:MAG: YdcF family protein [Sphingomonadaceae bacterium]|nr:YdcF family protein [Sphingomonadaceae bacterium]